MQYILIILSPHPTPPSSNPLSPIYTILINKNKLKQVKTNQTRQNRTKQTGKKKSQQKMMRNGYRCRYIDVLMHRNFMNTNNQKPQYTQRTFKTHTHKRALTQRPPQILLSLIFCVLSAAQHRAYHKQWFVSSVRYSLGENSVFYSIFFNLFILHLAHYCLPQSLPQAPPSPLLIRY